MRPTDGSPSRLRLWIGIGTAVVVLVAGLLDWFLNREKPIEVTVATARAMPATSAGTSVLDATGYVTARRQATVSAKITGKVRDVRIEEGQHVEAGEILATLDDSEARVDVELRRAQVCGRARAQLDRGRGRKRERRARVQAPAGNRRPQADERLRARRGAHRSRGLRARVASQTSAVRVAQEALAGRAGPARQHDRARAVRRRRDREGGAARAR